MEWLRRVWYLLNRRRAERDMDEEMAYHREMAGGAGFGSDLRLREDAREVWGWTWLDRLRQDLTHGARVLARAPGFTLTALLVLALGIGVTLTAARMLLLEMRPSRAPDPDTLVELERDSPGSRSTNVVWPEVQYFAQNSRSFRSIMGRVNANVIFGDESESIPVGFVTANYFSEFDMRAVEGRVLLAALDEVPGAEPVAVLSNKFWERRLGANRAAVGQIIRLSGKPVRVVGIVAAPRDRTVVWMPLVRQPYVIEGSSLLTDWKGGGVTMYGRYRAGVSPRAAEEETRALAATLRQERPDDVFKGEYLAARPTGIDAQAAGAAAVATMLVLLVLIIACTNLGTLLLARGVAREREIRTRMALGADRRRVIRQLLTESTLLALIGSGLALALSTVALRVAQLRLDGPDDFSIVPDWRVMAATLLIGLVAAGSFGLVPALRLTSGAPRAGRARTVFLAVQVAGSCVLLMISGLLVRGFERLTTADPGFAYQHVVVIEPGLDAHGYRGPAAQAYMQALSARLLALPGVERVSVADLPPWGNMVSQANRNGYRVSMNFVDQEFLPTLGLELTKGRNFRPGESGSVIVSESVARWLWPAEDPLGKRTDLGQDATVVGVVRKAGTFNLRTEDTMGIYFPSRSDRSTRSCLVARVAGKPAAYESAFAGAAKALDTRLTPNAHSLQGAYDNKLSENLALTATVGSLGMLGTLLAAIGLAGLTAYTVGQRTREIGVRIALGARRAQVAQAVFAPLAWPVGIGLGVGMLVAAAMASVLERQIFGLHPLDLVAYAAAIALFSAVVFLATIAPARRAMRVNPSEALRHE